MLANICFRVILRLGDKDAIVKPHSTQYSQMWAFSGTFTFTLLMLTFSCIMLKNGQTCFKNLTVSLTIFQH